MQLNDEKKYTSAKTNQIEPISCANKPTNSKQPRESYTEILLIRSDVTQASKLLQRRRGEIQLVQIVDKSMLRQRNDMIVVGGSFVAARSESIFDELPEICSLPLASRPCELCSRNDRVMK